MQPLEHQKTGSSGLSSVLKHLESLSKKPDDSSLGGRLPSLASEQGQTDIEALKLQLLIRQLEQSK